MENEAPIPDEKFPGDGVPIDLFGDGVTRELRYDFATLKRLKKKLGKSMIGPAGGILEMDEELLPEMIYEGLRGPDGKDPDVTLEQIERIPSKRMLYLIQTVNAAFLGDMPKKKALADLAAATARKPN